MLVLVIIGIFLTLTSLYLTIGPISLGIMNSVPLELRGQANALCYFIIHLLGDFPSPYLYGIVESQIGMR